MSSNKGIVNRKKLCRIRAIYGCVAGILLLCLGLFFFNVIAAEDTEQIEHIASGQYGDKDLTFMITNLQSGDALIGEERELVSKDGGVKMFSRVNRFDVMVQTDAEQFDKWGEMHWVMVLQGLSVALLIAIVVLTIIVLFSFYRNLKLGKVFPSKNIKVIRWIGILLIVMSLMADVSTYIERKMALDFLMGTGWEPDVRLSIHFTRIFFGLVIVLLAEIFYVGYEMQEEQELTI